MTKISFRNVEFQCETHALVPVPVPKTVSDQKKNPKKIQRQAHKPLTFVATGNISVVYSLCQRPVIQCLAVGGSLTIYIKRVHVVSKETTLSLLNRKEQLLTMSENITHCLSVLKRSNTSYNLFVLYILYCFQLLI